MQCCCRITYYINVISIKLHYLGLLDWLGENQTGTRLHITHCFSLTEIKLFKHTKKILFFKVLKKTNKF